MTFRSTGVGGAHPSFSGADFLFVIICVVVVLVLRSKFKLSDWKTILLFVIAMIIRIIIAFTVPF